MRYDKADLEQAIRTIQEGGIILYPTDTVWGIGCDATNEEAVSKIFRLKQREDSKSMLVLLDAPGKLQGYVQDIPDIAYQLLEVSEGAKPLTIIYPKAKNLAKNLIAEDGSVGIRITEEAFSRALCAGLKRPIVSTSANISGEPTAHFFAEISNAIKEGVDYVCQFRQQDDTPHEPSSIILLRADGTMKVIR